MKKYLALLILSCFTFIIFNSCEENDICIDPKTPQLIIKFNNENNPKEKMDSLFVLKQNPDDTYTQVAGGVGRDSIIFPLPLEKTDHTTIIVSKRSAVTDFADAININYDYRTEYVSKACGFKAQYKILSIKSPTTNFIKSYKILRNEVTDQVSAHIQLNY
ncbi:hypothetical protein KRX57_10390 [Weeksellaceae bacterium TAE3-ERU29]|nr:hypothetical protein [Weeksellaceae bacterium TAE3-ERU29]